MNRNAKSILIGVAAGLGAFGLCIFSTVIVQAAARTFSDPEAVSTLMYLQTGRVIRFQKVEEQSVETPTTPEQTEPAVIPDQPEEVLAAFAQEDAQLVQVHSYCGYTANVQTWLEQPLSWDLTQQEPTVLIIHSHATEGYADTESSGYRTIDTDDNVVAVGAALKTALESKGIGVIHDITLHDSPSYSDSYANSRETVEAYLEKYPSIALVLDIHRDAVTEDDGDEMAFSAQYNGQEAAQLMLVVGTDAGGLTHPDWESNMSLAVKLHAQLEKTCAGICRPISFRSQRFNQDLSPGALIIEVGGTGNTQQQALASVEILSQAICTLAAGTQ